MKLSVLTGKNLSPDPEISSITADSRKVKSGSLFVAVTGTKRDGADFVADAIARGAVAVIVPQGMTKPENADIAWIESGQPRRDLSHAVAKLSGQKPSYLTAVTGTNGKTSTVNFALQIWQALGISGASLGTLGVRGYEPTGMGNVSMTTPDPVTLHACLAEMSASGITHAALEASSHGLDQFRLDGLTFKAAGFTNLTRDHLDYHPTMNDYRNAKFRLFTDLLEQGGTAVVNADVPECDLLRDICSQRQLRLWTYGSAGTDFRIAERLPVPHGQKLRLSYLGRQCTLSVPLVGQFQIMNLLCAAGLVTALDEKRTDDILDILPRISGVPGRLQAVSGHPCGAAVYVDYAHTPDALENILLSLRPHVDGGKLVCVFGCGGDRDKGKRPVMGQIAVKLSDTVIVTDDNPRSENPETIRAEIMAGAHGAKNIGGRREAIRAAIRLLEPGDILVIAGKGHEQGQIFADRTEPFDDVNEAHSAMQEAS